jgi:hypothetical protein
MPISYEEVFDATAKVLARALEAEQRNKQLEAELAALNEKISKLVHLDN